MAITVERYDALMVLTPLGVTDGRSPAHNARYRAGVSPKADRKTRVKCA